MIPKSLSRMYKRHEPTKQRIEKHMTYAGEIIADRMEEQVRQGQVGGEHYKEMDIQPWDALEVWLTKEEFLAYLKAEAIVYLAREKKKGGAQDIQKALHCLNKWVEIESKSDSP